MALMIPEKPAEAIAALRRAGIRAWVIGGAVRDGLLGREAFDWDLTVACSPEQLAAALPEAKPIGGAYGTVSWHGVEITPCRAEAGYTDHRHPDSVTFGGTLEDDLARRDFTVNAIAYDGTDFTDPYRGQKDLAAKLLRCVGEPSVRFSEDALRILRLFRFAGTLGFSIERRTEAAALRLAPSLKGVSAQRVRGELNKALQGPHPAALAPLIAADGLKAFGFSARQLKANPAALAPLDAVPESMLCRWWALIYLTGSDARRCAAVFDFGHSFMRDFMRLDDFYHENMPADRHALKLMLRDEPAFPFADAAETFAAVCPEFAGLPAMYDSLRQSREPYLISQLAITPPEMLLEGVPNRQIGGVQKCLLKAVIDTPELNNYPMLAQMARSLRNIV